MQTNESFKLKLPFEIQKVDPEVNKKLLEHFKGERTGYVQVGPKKYIFAEKYTKLAEDLYNFQFRSDDIMINTFGRSGTTWMQELVWLLVNDLNFKKALELPLPARFPFLDSTCSIHDDIIEELRELNQNDEGKLKIIQSMEKPVSKILSQVEGPRLIKTHIPFSLLSPSLFETGCKIIYLARNPKDVAVSFYYFEKSLRIRQYIGDFPTYWNYFKNNLTIYSPYWEHLKEAWAHRHEPNFLFLFYEEMIQDLPKIVKKVSDFVGKEYTNEDLAPLVEHLKFDNFRKNRSVNYDNLLDIGVRFKNEAAFIRQGKSGGWKEHFTDEMNLEADQWIEENLRGTDIKFA